MPRQYMTVSEFEEGPLGYNFSGQLKQLGVGVVDKLIFRASQRVDSLCKKRIGAPLSTTLSAQAYANATQISVASTLGYDNGAEQAVILDSGTGSQETVLIQPGGVSVTSYLYPYPGTITLATPLQNGHSLSASVTGCYREVTMAGSSSSGDPYAEALQSQAAQLALAHLPMRYTGLTRVVFTNNYPIIGITAVDHAYSYDVAYNSVDVSSIIIEPLEGWYRFMVGQVILPEGMMRTTYTAGYQTVPDDIKRATELLVADELVAFANPYGAFERSAGKVRYKFGDAKTPKTLYISEAEEICKPYRRTL